MKISVSIKFKDGKSIKVSNVQFHNYTANLGNGLTLTAGFQLYERHGNVLCAKHLNDKIECMDIHILPDEG